MKRIAVISATKISIEPVEAAAKQFPDVEIIHLLDEGMSYLCKMDGYISEKNMARMISLIRKAEDLDVDGIMLSCTIFSPYVDVLRVCTSLPLIAADIGVFEQAAKNYTKVGAVVSFEPTMKSVADVVSDCKEYLNPNFDVEIKLAEGAFEALSAGDVQMHNQKIYETACAMAKGKEAIVLSQMSHMRALPLFENFPIPVLTSPPVSIQLLCDKIDEEK